jgi:hypothetical protein
MDILCTLAARCAASVMAVVSRSQGAQNLQLLVVGGHPPAAAKDRFERYFPRREHQRRFG